MDILSLAFLLIALAIYDEILNGQMKISQKSLGWLDRKTSNNSKTVKN